MDELEALEIDAQDRLEVEIKEASLLADFARAKSTLLAPAALAEMLYAPSVLLAAADVAGHLWVG